jgi:hypothetical protein
VDATPVVVDQMVDAVTAVVEEGVMALPAMVSQEVNATEAVSVSMDAVPDFSETMYVDEDEELAPPKTRKSMCLRSLGAQCHSHRGQCYLVRISSWRAYKISGR